MIIESLIVFYFCKTKTQEKIENNFNKVFKYKGSLSLLNRKTQEHKKFRKNEFFCCYLAGNAFKNLGKRETLIESMSKTNECYIYLFQF